MTALRTSGILDIDRFDINYVSDAVRVPHAEHSQALTRGKNMSEIAHYINNPL